MKNYSQNSEQDAIHRYFGNYIGTFLDIGANDGITFSNTYALAIKGWKGVCIEPSPRAYTKLMGVHIHPDCAVFCFNLAIGPEEGKLTLHESGSLVSKDDVGLVSSFIPAEVERFKKVTTWKEVEVNCLRWRTFMKDYSPFDSFDFISIDIEGLEIEVLEQIDLSNTKCICVETNGSQDKKRSLDNMLTGFQIIYTSGENLIYAK